MVIGKLIPLKSENEDLSWKTKSEQQMTQQPLNPESTEPDTP